jgi:hypothetical protein
MLTGGLLPFPRTGCVLYAKAILSYGSEIRQDPLRARSYSVRIANVGSMRTARAAGIEQAPNATSATMPPTVANVTGSRAGTSNSSVAMRLAAANAPINPTTMPPQAHVIPSLNTSPAHANLPRP